MSSQRCNHGSYITADLNRWSLAPQYHPGAQRSQPTEELHRQDPLPADGPKPLQSPLDLRDPRATSFRSEPTRQPDGQTSHQGSADKGSSPTPQ